MIRRLFAATAAVLLSAAIGHADDTDNQFPAAQHYSGENAA
jgi:hypothetical protein